MTSELRDDALAERFAELRSADARRAPPFASMWRPSPSRSRVSPWWIAAPAFTFVAAAAALAIWVGQKQLAEPAAASAPPAATPQLAISRIEPGPLDFLLDQPSLAAIPDFDSDPGYLLRGLRRDGARRP